LEFRSANGKEDAEEIFCNKVASELLLPRNELTKNIYNKSEIQKFAEVYKVSEIFVFYRLKDLGKIKSEMVEGLEREILTDMAQNVLEKTLKEKGKKGGNSINAMRDSNGSLFNKIVSQSYLENNIGYIEASRLLRFSPEKV
jgi:Zn-dependent peptidase ImmA (M78 family)